MYYFQFDNHSKILKRILPETAALLSQTADVGGCLGAVDDDDELAGYLVLFPSGRRKTMMRISDIKVAKDMRRQGVGSTLVENAKKLSLIKGFTSMGICAEIAEEKNEIQLFLEESDFVPAKKEYRVLSYTLDMLQNSKILEFDKLDENVLPEVAKIPNSSHDLALRFETKCKDQGYYFERKYYDPLLTAFCVESGDVVGAASLEVQGNGHLRIADLFKDKECKTKYIEPALILELVKTALEYFDGDTIFEICIDKREDASKYTAILGQAMQEKFAREYYCRLVN